MRNIGKVFLWLLVVASVGYAVYHVNEQQRQMRCKGTDISVFSHDGVALTDSADIMQIINSTVDSLTERSLQEIPLKRIEARLRENPFIKSADVMFTFGGYLKIRVKTYNPVVRVISDRHHTFFIDEKGILLPAQAGATAHVPPASGNINIRVPDSLIHRNVQIKTLTDFPVLKEIFNLATKIRSSEFLDAQIDQIYVNPAGEYELIPKIGNHVILLGNLKKLDNKLLKLEAFYKQAMPANGWKKYKRINLKYSNQIVCSKI